MTPLETILVDRIRQSGPMPFAAFMSLALYHPQHGYYTSERVRLGWRGDYVTAPQLTVDYGALWTRAFAETWQLCGRPDRFEVIEIGPGEGRFAAAVLATAEGAFGDALRYRLVERSPAARARQEQLLDGTSIAVSWSPSITEVPPAQHGCVFANEILDNTPVHLVTKRAGRLLEVCVGVTDDALGFVELEPSNPELERFLERCGVDLPDGHRFEVGLAAESLVQRAAAMFEVGCAVFVDYGLTASELTARPDGSLLAYSASGVDDRVLTAPGERDVTAHANWTSVEAACAAAGLIPIPRLSQRVVLERLGLHELHDALKRFHDDAIKDKRGADAVNALSRRQALGAIADPGGLGGLQVLVATRGIEAPSFAS